MSCPSERCGFTATYDSENPSNPPRSTCWREVWENGCCIWHADQSAKPVAELQNARTDHFEDLSGAILRHVDAEGELDFAKCYLNHADLSEANFSDTSFADAKALRATFEGGNFRRTDFSGIMAWEANLSNTTLLKADFREASVIRAELHEANLGEADCQKANFSDSTLTKADLSSADLEEAQFRISGLHDVYLKNANLQKADFANANLTDANLTGVAARYANFEEANLTRVNLFDADLDGGSVYGAVLDGTQINRRTNFANQYAAVLETDADWSDDSHPNIWDKTRWVFRQAERLAKENALPDQAREYYITRKNIRRREYHHGPGLKNKYRWLKAICSWGVMEYGENPRRVIGASVLVILLFGVVYPFVGGMQTSPDTTVIDYAFQSPVPLSYSIPQTIKTIFANLYFSGVTFTTLGYGDIQPATPVVDFLATLESFIGSLLMALLVFVLGRRSTW